MKVPTDEKGQRKKINIATVQYKSLQLGSLICFIIIFLCY